MLGRKSRRNESDVDSGQNGSFESVSGNCDKESETAVREPSFVPCLPEKSQPTAEFIGTKPVVTFSPEAYKRQLVYTELAGKEVAWLGTVVRDGVRFHIDNIYLLRQEVGEVEVTFSPASQAELCAELDQVDPELDNRLQFWGHSHVRFPTIPSPADDRSAMNFHDGRPFFIRFIINKRGETDLTVYMFKLGYELAVKVADVEWYVVDDERGVVLDKNTRLTDNYPFEFAGDTSGGVERRGLLARRGEPFPELLVPSEALRRELREEFARKVTDIDSRLKRVGR